MEFLDALLLFVAAMLGGGLSAVAGGATFFTFPALLFVGLPPLAANATNFVALVPSNIAALPAYGAELRAIGPGLFGLMAVAGLGGFAGAILLLAMGGGVFATLVPYLLGVATVLFAAAPYLRRWFRSPHDPAKRNVPLAMMLLFGYSVYGGYFGAGLGQIMLAALMLYGVEDFHLANALKNGVISAISLVAVCVYGLSGAVAWPEAIVMMTGAAIGGFFGGRMSKHVPQRVLRYGVIGFGLFLTIFYFAAGV